MVVRKKRLAGKVGKVGKVGQLVKLVGWFGG